MIHHVQVAYPVGGEPDQRSFYAEALGWKGLDKPPLLTRRGGCWFKVPGVGGPDGEIHADVEETSVLRAKRIRLSWWTSTSPRPGARSRGTASNGLTRQKFRAAAAPTPATDPATASSPSRAKSSNCPTLRCRAAPVHRWLADSHVPSYRRSPTGPRGQRRSKIQWAKHFHRTALSATLHWLAAISGERGDDPVTTLSTAAAADHALTN